MKKIIPLVFFLSVLTLHAQDTLKSRLTIGTYGEAVYRYNFYSDNVFRYTFADRFRDAKGHGEVDLPHAVVMLGYDFGKGWSFGMEVEFEHGGVEAAVELETEETGEYEKEIERGGEVALEQLWIQKSWSPALNLRLGHQVVPVGSVNAHHLPTEFLGVFRPEGERTILPCTWHETGISFWGRKGAWRYEAQLLPALNSALMDVSGWANGASASPYESRPANHLALAARLDHYPTPGLRMSLSGYIGNTFRNDITTDQRSTRFDTCRGTMAIVAFDFLMHKRRLSVRGNLDFGYLHDAQLISAYNTTLPNSTGSPYPHTKVGRAAWAFGHEFGYDLLDKRLTPFLRIDVYDSYLPAGTMSDIEWTLRHAYTAGLNYRPLPEIALKAEVGYRRFAPQYNPEPWFAIGATWAAMMR